MGFRLRIACELNKMKKTLIVLGTAVLVFLMCSLVRTGGASERNDASGNLEKAIPYVRPAWVYLGATNVVHKPFGTKLLEDQPGLYRSKLRLPVECGVSVTRGVSTNPSLSDVYVTISNAIVKANEILGGKHYAVRMSGGAPFLIWKDAVQNSIWRLMPSGRSGKIVEIEVVRYEDDNLTMLNAAESYTVSFNMDGSLSLFRSWNSSVILQCEHMDWENPPYDIKLVKRIGPASTQVMRFDSEGKLVGERVGDDASIPPP